GAYTARALAGLITAKGLLATKYQQGDAESYEMAQRARFLQQARPTPNNAHDAGPSPVSAVLAVHELQQALHAEGLAAAHAREILFRPDATLAGGNDVA
ncbi:MAG: DUF2235 domain-containing protein, partial [Rhodospirillaceae bacterium]|nr:DUF2235 domain-containing protein [Rhodospirillaceae bacterium]